MNVPAFQHVEHVMGTAVVFDLPSGDVGNAVAEAIEFLHWVDATFSVYRADSQISRIARGELDHDDASAEVRLVLGTCEALRSGTGSWFDHRPTSGSRRLDPSGYVKGWSLDEAAMILQIAGVADFCISAGGDVRAAGEPEPRRPWQVGIRHPIDTSRSLVTISITDGAVATSGRYERGEHIWPPSRPGTSLLSATIIGPELGTADALATAILAADGGVDLVQQYPDYRFLTIDRDLRVVRHGWQTTVASA